MSCKAFVPGSPAEGMGRIGGRHKGCPYFSNLVYLTQRKSAPVLTYERQKEAKAEVQRAVALNRFFTIQGPYHAVREGLRRRGWVEKFYLFSIYRNRLAESQQNSEDNEMIDGDGNRIHLEDHGSTVPPWKESAGYYGLMSRLVQKYEPMFFWGVRRDVFDPKLLKPNQLVNHFSRAAFTSKVGLCKYLHDLPWFEQNCSKTFYPRSYQLAKAEEKNAFEEDFCLTACVSLLKILNESFLSTKPLDGKETGKYLIVSEKILSQALQVCRRYLSSIIHDDIDEPSSLFWIGHYEELLDVYYQARKLPGSVVCSDVSDMSLEIDVILQEISNKCPQFEIDGTRNVWIVKPGAKSRGRGIQCFDDLKEILKLVENGSCISEKKYVIQKYIEKPLLVYKTKFDIRQWFLVTDWNPLTLWFYKECYLRFCSQEFTLDDFCLSIHLSNNSIQKNFKNGEARSTKLPDDNMWTCHRFKNFLSENGAPEGVWDQIIYDGMKKAIVWSLLCCQEVVEHRKNTFELYGADFMLGENYQPWLIEINASPCMAASTSVTAHLCPRVLEDTLKVVLDKNGDTGLFELAYKQQQVSVPALLGLNLKVCGQSIVRPPTTSQSIRVDRRLVGLKSKKFKTVSCIVSNNNAKKHSLHRRPWYNYENLSSFSGTSTLDSASVTSWSIDSGDDVKVKSKFKKQKIKRKKSRKISSLMKKESGKCQVCFRNGRVRCVCSKSLDLEILSEEEFTSLPNLRGFKAFFPNKQTRSTDGITGVCEKKTSKEPGSLSLSPPLPSLEFLKTSREDQADLRIAGKTLSTSTTGLSYLKACPENSTSDDNYPPAWINRYTSASTRKPLRSCSKEGMTGLQRCISAKSSAPVGNWTAFPTIGQKSSIFGQLSSTSLSANRVENENDNALSKKLTATTVQRIVKSNQKRKKFNSGQSLAQLFDQLTLRPSVQRLKPQLNLNAEENKKCRQTAST